MDYLQVKNSTGEVEVVITATEGQPIPTSDDLYTIFDVPIDEDSSVYFRKFYSFADNKWKDKPEKPAFYEYGQECELIFQENDFLADLRKKRNGLLQSSDWTQMPDSPLTQEQKQAWADYRQALRDLPQNLTDTGDVVWPEPPVL